VVADDRLEQLPHHSERQLPLELRAPSARHDHPRLRAPTTRRDQQLRLADPTRSLDHHQRARPRARRPQRVIDPRELGFALKERDRLEIHN
jgi:hypothetical protein